MADLLVRLFDLPKLDPLIELLKADGIIIRRPHPAETGEITSWVEQHFHAKWADECRAALQHRPPTCFIATQIQPIANPDDDPYNLPPEKLLGVACYDIVARGMFGPEAVHPDYRGRQIGKAMLLAALHEMAAVGYAYAVIAWAGPVAFYQKTVGATIIENSEPGIFRGPLIGK